MFKFSYTSGRQNPAPLPALLAFCLSVFLSFRPAYQSLEGTQANAGTGDRMDAMDLALSGSKWERVETLCSHARDHEPCEICE